MPVSDKENKHIVKEWIDQLDPSVVIDIGPGAGTYSMLARQPHQKWYGIEVYYPYVTHYELYSKYEDIIVADARYVDYSLLPRPNLVIVGDCIEHMNEADGKRMIKQFTELADYVLISVPMLHLDQGTVEGNIYETHIHHWSDESMKQYLDTIGVTLVETVKGEILGYYLVCKAV